MSALAPQAASDPAHASVAHAARTLRAQPTEAALALVALHVVNVLVLSPRAGARVSDHLIGLLVVAALLGAAWVGIRRGRPGVAAAWELCLVAPCAAGFGLALADAQARGAGGADLTGLLLIVPALIFAVVGVRRLWHSRRRDGHVVVRRVLKAVLALVLAFEVVVPVTLAIVATQRPRDAAQALDLGTPTTPVELRTSDGVELAGSYVRPRNGAVVILFPRAGGAQRHARMLVRHGYGVVALDMRGYGASQGDPNAYGWGSDKDIDAAVAYLRRRPEVRTIGGLGLSVGGEQMIDAAASNPRLAAVVADGAGERSVKETAIHGWRAALVMPQQAILTTAVAALSGHAPPPSLRDQASRVSPRALFLIQAANGHGGEELDRDYFDSAHTPKQYWKVPGAGHTGGLNAHPAEYERRVIAFFDRYLLGE